MLHAGDPPNFYDISQSDLAYSIQKGKVSQGLCFDEALRDPEVAPIMLIFRNLFRVLLSKRLSSILTPVLLYYTEHI